MTSNGLDDAVRQLSTVRDEHVARFAGSEARERLLEGITAMPAQPPGRRRGRLAVVASGVTVSLAASAAIGWAIVAGNPRDTTALMCDIPPDSLSIIDAVSGDPVADCAAEWQRQTGSAPPPLVAYDNGRGGVVVAAASAPVPEGATPLPPGQTQNLALIELEESLGDHVAGLASRCYEEAGAVRYAEAELARLGLSGWVVRVRRGGACVDGAAVDPATRTVSLFGGAGDPSAPDEPYTALARRLAVIARRCLPLDAAATQVEAAARDLGLSPDREHRQYTLTKVVKDTRCTSIRQNVGGTIVVTLRGPRR